MSQTHAFVENVYFDELESDKQIFTIDIKKCRKNILYYGKFDYCVFTVFDKIDEFKEIFNLVYIMLNLIIICRYVGMVGIITI